jgi:aryl-alcohol dehydrogenase-like predicted oxidoreductase
VVPRERHRGDRLLADAVRPADGRVLRRAGGRAARRRLAAQRPRVTTNLDRNLALAAALEPVAQRHGVPVGAVAVAWTLAWPGVTGAIVGARRPEQINGWIAANDLTLTADDLTEIADAINRTGAGEGPTRPGPLSLIFNL